MVFTIVKFCWLIVQVILDNRSISYPSLSVSVFQFYSISVHLQHLLQNHTGYQPCWGFIHDHRIISSCCISLIWVWIMKELTDFNLSESSLSFFCSILKDWAELGRELGPTLAVEDSTYWHTTKGCWPHCQNFSDSLQDAAKRQAPGCVNGKARQEQ